MVWRQTRKQVARMRRESPGQLVAPPTRTYTYTLAVLSALLTPVPVLQSWGNWIVQAAFSASFIFVSIYCLSRAANIPKNDREVQSTNRDGGDRIKVTKKGWLIYGLI